MMNKPIHGPPTVPCVNCSNATPIPEQIPADYFSGIRQPCNKCKRPFDWWDAITRAVREEFWMAQVLAPVGARWTVIQTILEPDTLFTLTFSDHSIPSDAQILDVVYTPQGSGGLFPLETHGNRPQRHLIPPVVRLYPWPLGDGPRDTKIAILVTWVPSGAASIAWQHLIDAFEAYALGDYPSAVIPGNVAVEITLSQTLAELLEKSASREKYVLPFLRDAATYAHQLNVLLPSFVAFANAPKLSDAIRGELNRLRTLRNELAHRGTLEKPLEKNEAASIVCAALFGFHYLNVIRPTLLEKVSESRTQS